MPIILSNIANLHVRLSLKKNMDIMVNALIQITKVVHTQFKL